MQDQILNRSKDTFNKLAYHYFLYGDISTSLYFKVSPIRYSIFKILSVIQDLLIKMILSRKKFPILIAYVIKFIDPIIQWDSDNIMSIKIVNPKKYLHETFLLFVLVCRLIKKDILYGYY